MNSKEKFLNTACELFSKFGFSGVSVRDIAKALNMRESAMYKHFSSKADILDSIILKAKYKLEQFQKSLETENKSVRELLTIMQEKLLEFYTLDIFMNQFRKIMIISQYENEVSKLRYQEMFITKSLSYYENVFEVISKNQKLEVNAKLMAYELYAPLFLLLQLNDNESDKQRLESSKKLLREHIDAFFSRYSFLEVAGNEL